MQPEEQQRIMGYFIEEAKDHLNTIEQGLLNLQATIEDSEKANEIFRAAHSVKGGAAMLGLESIQKTAHRMEDYFKVLKESPIQVDRILETMFLRISDGLKDLLEQLEGPFGLTQDKAQEIMADVEPVFEQIEEHLSALVSQPITRQAGGVETAIAPNATSLETIKARFKRDGASFLRKMLAAFKQPDDAASRKSIQDTCAQLYEMGEQFGLSAWCDLIETARLAAANTDNDYRALAPVLIKDIKQAQDFVLAGRASEISVSEAMQALLPEDILAEDAIADDSSGISDFDLESSLEDSLHGLDFPGDEDTENDSEDFEDLFEEKENAADTVSDSSRHSVRSISEVEEADNLDSLFEEDVSESLSKSSEVETDVSSTDPPDEEDDIERLSLDLDFNEIPSELSTLDRNADSKEKTDESLDALLATVNVTGPEVGQDELNSLADLFDGDLDELDNTLGGHAFATEEMQLHPEKIDLSPEDDLKDLLSSGASEERAAELTDVEDGDLFGGTLTDGEFATTDDIGFEELDELSAESASFTSNSLSEDVEDLSKDPWAEEDADDEIFETEDTLFGVELGFDSVASSADDLSAANLSAVDLSLADSETADVDSTAEDSIDSDFSIGSLDSDSSDLDSSDLDSSDLDSLDLDSLDLDSSDALLLEDDWPDESLNTPKKDSFTHQKRVAPKIVPSHNVSPKEDEIEFPTLTGEQLQEAEEDIDSFFLDEDLESEMFDESSDRLEPSDDDLWGELSIEQAPPKSETVEDAALDDTVSDLESDDLLVAELSEDEEQLSSDEEALGAELLKAEVSTDYDIDLDVEQAGADLLDDLLETEETEANIEAPVVEEAEESASDSLWDDLSAEESGSIESSELDFSDLEISNSEDSQYPLGDEDQTDLSVDLSVDLSSDDLEAIADSAQPLAPNTEAHNTELSDTEAPDAEAPDTEAEDDWLTESSLSKANLEVDLLEEKDLFAESLPGSANVDDLDDVDFGDADLDFDALETDSSESLTDLDAELSEDWMQESSLDTSDERSEEGSADDENSEDEEVSAPTRQDVSGEDLSDEVLADFETAFGTGTFDFVSLDEIAASDSDKPVTDESVLDRSAPEQVSEQPDASFLGSLSETSETNALDISELEIDGLLDDGLELDGFLTADELAEIDESLPELAPDIDSYSEASVAELSLTNPSTNSFDFPSGAETSKISTSQNATCENTEAALEIAADEPEVSFDDLDALLSEESAGDSSKADDSAQGTDDREDNLPTAVGEPSAVGTTDEDFGDLERLLEDGPADGTPTVPQRRSPQATARRSGIREQTMRVSVNHLDTLSNLVGELVVSRNTLERDQERLRQFLDNLLFQVQQLNDVGQRMRDLYERSLLESSLMSNRRAHDSARALSTQSDDPTSFFEDHATGETFDALEMDRFTGFHTLSQEMIELIVRVRESSSDIGYTVESSDQVTRQFRQITTQLQEGLNTARMVAFSQAADRLPRAVRDISHKCGKEARLIVEGQDTLIDKMIVEHLYDPLTHLVNNAITHGIETPQARKAAGKLPEGMITVRAFYQGNQTVIYVADDGGGINTEFVKRKALEKNLITQAEAQDLSDIETYELLFHPGFSTRDQADDFAGRGVGMDVVRTSLAEIRGSITIDSELGKGTSFTIRLPLTLSISKALSCVSNQARIAFPMDGVEDMLDVPRDRLVKNEEGRDCVRWRDALLTFQPVTDLLKFNRTLGRGRVYGGSQDDDVLSIIVLRSANTYIAVQVDQVIGEQEIVIKQLEGPVPKPLGIAGATVLGDGRVMPIADVIELIDIAMGRVRREPASMLWTQDETAEIEETPVKNDPTVLIVDDSITVRELLSMSFNKVGYRVEQARDGQEAWDKLRSGLPCDLVFCDIEMPRMDGLELLSRMQKDNHLKSIPIAMLTSRGADRHRQMAVDLGASGYFTKPYLEEALLDAAQRMLNGETLAKGRGG